MSVFLDYNSKYTSNVFNAKDSYLYSSGVLKHIPLNSLNTFITSTSSFAPSSTTLPAINSGVLVINGLVVVMDSTTQLLTGSCPNNTPIALGVTTQSNIPYFSLYPNGVLPNNYIKVATFLQGVNEWVYEPVIGPNQNILINSFGFKNDNHYLSNSMTSVPMLGNTGFVHSDSSFMLGSAGVDSRCGISITSSYPVVSGSGHTFSYTTQTVLDPFTKSFLNIPTSVSRSSIQTITVSLPSLYASSFVQTIPGVMITSGGVNAESYIAAYSTTSTALGTDYGIAAVSFANGTASIITGVPATIVTDNVFPVLLPSLSPNGHKFICLNGGNTYGYNIQLSASGTLSLANMDTVIGSSSISPNYLSGATLGGMSFALAQNSASGDFYIGLVSSNPAELSLWPTVSFTGTSVTSQAKLLVDTHAVAHVLFLSGTSLMSYDYPLGSGAPAGTYSTLFTGATYFNATQNMFGDSLIAVLTTSTAYKSINYGAWTNIGAGANYGSSGWINLNADLSYFNMAVSANASLRGVFQVGLDGLEISSSGGFTGYPYMGSATLSPILVNGTTLSVYPLIRTITTQPSIVMYRYNPSAYPSGNSEIVYTNNYDLENRINPLVDLNGNVRPINISSTAMYVLGDEPTPTFWRIHCVSGTVYANNI